MTSVNPATAASGKLDPAFKADWIAALRSGNYVQGRHRLKMVDEETGEIEHCCLGVAVEIKNPASLFIAVECQTLNQKFFRQRGSSPDDASGYFGACTVGFCAEVGLSIAERNVLMNKNDACDAKGKHKHTFADIADYIEEHL